MWNLIHRVLALYLIFLVIMTPMRSYLILQKANYMKIPVTRVILSYNVPSPQTQTGARIPPPSAGKKIKDGAEDFANNCCDPGEPCCMVVIIIAVCIAVGLMGIFCD